MYYKHILMIYSLTLVEDRFQSNYIKILISFIHHRQFSAVAGVAIFINHHPIHNLIIYSDVSPN